MAYELFDGKYSMAELTTIPYKELIRRIEQEQYFQREISTKRTQKEIREYEQQIEESIT